jgi:L-aminopeptidase/D-esterase-like protein
MYDGDIVFALATGQHPADFNLVSAFAADVVAEAIRNGVREATSMGGVPAARDVKS